MRIQGAGVASAVENLYLFPIDDRWVHGCFIIYNKISLKYIKEGCTSTLTIARLARLSYPQSGAIFFPTF